MSNFRRTLLSVCIAVLGLTAFSQAYAADRKSNLTVKTANIKSSSMIKDCDVDLQYPQFIGLPAANVAQINSKLQQIINQAISKDKEEAADIETPPELKGQRGWFMSRYTVATANNNLISLQINWERMYAGAAHPMHWSTVFNYQVNPIKEITLQQLFKPGSDYLEKLSFISTADLLKTLLPQGATDADWIKKGAKADAKVYGNFTLSSNALTINFDEYDVACYASGPQKVTIPYAQLKNILNPQTPVYSLAH